MSVREPLPDVENLLGPMPSPMPGPMPSDGSQSSSSQSSSSQSSSSQSSSSQSSSSQSSSSQSRKPWISRVMSNAVTWLMQGPHAIYGVAMLRIILGLTLTVQMLVNFPFRSYLWGSASAWSQEISANAPFPFQRSIFGPVADASTVTVAYCLLFLASISLVLGWHTRISTVVVLILHTLMTFSDGIYMDQSDNLVRMLLIYGVFIRLGEKWSLDARFERQLSARRAERGVEEKPYTSSSRVFVRTVHNLALCAVALHLCLIYVSSAMFKIQGDTWQDGTAVYFPLQVPHFRPFPELSDLAVQGDISVNIATYAAVYLQLFFPFLLLNKWTRRVALVGVVGMHASIAVLMGLPFFSAYMLAGDAIFVSSATYVLVAAWISDRSARVRKRFSSASPSRDLAAGDLDPRLSAPMPLLIDDDAAANPATAASQGLPLESSPWDPSELSNQHEESCVDSRWGAGDLIPSAGFGLLGTLGAGNQDPHPIPEESEIDVVGNLEVTAPLEFPHATEESEAQEELESPDELPVGSNLMDEIFVVSASSEELGTGHLIDVEDVEEDTIQRAAANTTASRNTVSSFIGALDDSAMPTQSFPADFLSQLRFDSEHTIAPIAPIVPLSPAVWAEGAYARLKRSRGSASSSQSVSSTATPTSSPTAETRITTEELTALTGMETSTFTNACSAPSPHEYQLLNQRQIGEEIAGNSTGVTDIAATPVLVAESGIHMSVTTRFATPNMEVQRLLAGLPRDNEDTRAISRKLALYGSVLDTLPPQTSEIYQVPASSSGGNSRQFTNPDALAQPLFDSAPIEFSPTVTQVSKVSHAATEAHAKTPVVTPSGSSPEGINQEPAGAVIIGHAPPPIDARSAIDRMSASPRSVRGQYVHQEVPVGGRRRTIDLDPPSIDGEHANTAQQEPDDVIKIPVYEHVPVPRRAAGTHSTSGKPRHSAESASDSAH